MRSKIRLGGPVLPIVGDIDSALYEKVLAGLCALNETSRVKRITALLNTPGGDVYQAFAICDLLRASPKPVDIVVNGPCLSAGVFILQAAQGRAATPHSYLLIHPGGEEVKGPPRGVRLEVAHHDNMDEACQQLIQGRTGRPLEEVKLWMSQETYFSATEALAAGLIDEVLG